MTTPSGGNLVGDATIRVRADTDPALRAITNFARSAGTALRGVGSAAASLGTIGATVGAAVPVATALVAVLESIAPAGAAAATGMLAIGQASAVIQLAMVGVEDAVTAAFATGEDSAEQFREALEKLSPNAQAFVLELRGMRDELTDFQQSIQDRVFADLDTAVSRLARDTFPIFRDGLNETADTLNNMAIEAANAARVVSRDGTLGTAVDGANESLGNLSLIPAQVVDSLARLAAAGAPALDRFTQVVADVSTRISDNLSDAFESGRLEESVNRAVDVIFSLGRIVQDVSASIGNIFGALGVQGVGFVSVLEAAFDRLADVTGTQAFQEALRGIGETFSAVFQQITSALAGVDISGLFRALGEAIAQLPLEQLAGTLFPALVQIINSLGPVLVGVASAVGALVTALLPVVTLVGDLIALLAPVLVPILDALSNIFRTLSPLVASLAGLLSSILTPILSALPQLLSPILVALNRFLTVLTPIITLVIEAVVPAFEILATVLAELLTALGPVIAQVINLATGALSFLEPVINSTIGAIRFLTRVMTRALAGVIRSVVIPALRAIAAFLRGDFSDGFSQARNLISNVAQRIREIFSTLRARAIAILAGWRDRIVEIARSAGDRLRDAIQSRINRAVEIIRSLGRRAANALGGLGRTLFNAGRSLVQGFIDGIRSLIGSVTSTARSLVSAVTDFLPGSPARRGPLSGSGYVLLRGQRFTEDFARGIEDQERAVREASLNLASTASVSVTPVVDDLPLALVRPTGAVTATPMQINLTLSNQGVISSRAEVLDWLTRALEDLRRRNRLPLGGTL